MTLAKGTRVRVRLDVKNREPEDNVEDYAGKKGRISGYVFKDGSYDVLLDLFGNLDIYLFEDEMEVLDV